MARKSRKNLIPKNALSAVEYIRTAEYIRLSVEDSKNRGNSIENQKLIIDDYIARNVNLKLHDRYIDNGATGMDFNRPQFQRMLDDIEKGIIQCVIVKDLSRLGRNAIDTGFYIEKYFASKNVRFIAVTDNFDTDNSSDAGLLMPLKNIINEAYALDIGRKIKAQQRQAMRDGEFVGARPSYGYLKSPDNCHKLIIDEETAPVVQQIFEWFAGGMSLNEIVLQLNQRGIPSPSAYEYQKGIITAKKSVGSGYWQTWTVGKMLQEPIYTGNMVQGKTETTAHRQKPVTDKSKWITVENTHEAVISQELFDKVQHRFDAIAEKTKSIKIDPYTENIFKGKIFCGYCGRSMHRGREKRKTTADTYRFHCLANSRYARGMCEDPHIVEKDLTEVVITAIKGQADALIGKKRVLLTSLSDKKRINEASKKIRSLNDFITRNQDFLRSLYESLVSNVISAEEYHSMKDDYENKISGAVRQIHEIEAEQAELEKQYNRYCDLSDAALNICKNNKLTKELIGKLVDKILVYKDKRIEVVFSFENEFKNTEVSVNG